MSTAATHQCHRLSIETPDAIGREHRTTLLESKSFERGCDGRDRGGKTRADPDRRRHPTRLRHRFGDSLNPVTEPVMLHNVLASIQLLAEGVRSFDERCAAGIA